MESKHIDITPDDLAYDLSRCLESCKISPDGSVYEIRVRVDEFKGVRIEIRPNEHPPPHFHVECDGKRASYSIADCSLIGGGLPDNKDKKVRYWHGRNKQILIDIWNNTRPGDCIVGKFEPDVKA